MDWIKVTPETMPLYGEPILVTVKRGGERTVWCAEYSKGCFHSISTDFDNCWEESWGHGESGSRSGDVTHWMPLPEPADGGARNGKILKELALELLKKYEEQREAMIWEYSGSAEKSLKVLAKEVEYYKKAIEATNKLTE